MSPAGRRAAVELRYDYRGGRAPDAGYSYGAEGDRRRQAIARVGELRTDAAKLAQVQARIRSSVTELRAAGVSWAVIGDALGITRQAAAQRYRDDALL